MSYKILLALAIIAAAILLPSLAHATTQMRRILLIPDTNWNGSVLLTLSENLLVPFNGLFVTNSSTCSNPLPTWYASFGDKVMIMFNPEHVLMNGTTYTFYICYGDIVHEPDDLFTNKRTVALSVSVSSRVERDTGSTGWVYSTGYSVIGLENFGEEVYVINTTISYGLYLYSYTTAKVSLIDPNTGRVYITKSYTTRGYLSDTIVVKGVPATALAIRLDTGGSDAYIYINYDTYYARLATNSTRETIATNDSNTFWYIVLEKITENGSYVGSANVSLLDGNGSIIYTVTKSSISGNDCSYPVGVLVAKTFKAYLCNLSTGFTSAGFNTSAISLSLSASGYNASVSVEARVDYVPVLTSYKLTVYGAETPGSESGGGGGGGGAGSGNGTVIIVSGSSQPVIALVSGIALSSLGFYAAMLGMVRNKLEYAVMGMVLSVWSGFLFNYTRMPSVGWVVVFVGLGLSAVAFIDRVIDYVSK